MIHKDSPLKTGKIYLVFRGWLYLIFTSIIVFQPRNTETDKLTQRTLIFYIHWW